MVNAVTIAACLPVVFLALVAGFFDPAVAIGEVVGLWPMNEGSGQIVRDVSGNGYHGRGESGSLDWVPGVGGNGYALRFHGDSPTYVDFPGSSGWNFPEGFRLELDLSLHDRVTTESAVVGKHIGTVPEGYLISVENGHIGFSLGRGGYSTKLFTVGDYTNQTDPPTWYHVVGELDGATGLQSLNVYGYDSNGQRLPIPLETISQTSAYTPSSANLRIGSLKTLDPPGYTLATGDIDNVMLSAIPEPSTLVLLGIGALGLVAYAWRRGKRLA